MNHLIQKVHVVSQLDRQYEPPSYGQHSWEMMAQPSEIHKHHRKGKSQTDSPQIWIRLFPSFSSYDSLSLPFLVDGEAEALLSRSEPVTSNPLLVTPSSTSTIQAMHVQRTHA